MKIIFRISTILVFLFISLSSFGQEEIILEPDTIVPNNDSNEYFVFVEELPQFPGGDEARVKYLQKNISYPKEALELGVQGTVYVSFIIEKDGSISNIKCLRGPGGGLNKEAMRVVRNMPNWTPGTQKGKAVRCQFNMPIRFVLDTGDNVVKKAPTKKELKALEKKKKQEAKAKKKQKS